MSARSHVLTLLCLSVCFLIDIQIGIRTPAFAAPPRKATPARIRNGRDIQVIDGTWKFLVDPDGSGIKNGWDSHIADKAENVTIPSLWENQGAPGYSGAAWYWREFEVPKDWQGQMVRLRFEGAEETAEVWLNGKRLGTHDDGVTPFEFDVTKVVHIEGQNLLSVRLTGNKTSGAGLWQGVMLLAHDEAFISDCFPQTDSLGTMSAMTYLLNTSEHKGDATLEARLAAADEITKDITRTHQNLSITPGKNQTNLLLSVNKKLLHIWSPEKPFLYLLQLSFRQDKDILDTQLTTVGFRDFGIDNGAVTLNGAPIKLISIDPGMNRPIVLASEDDEQHMHDLFKRLKSKGVSVVYLQAPPPLLLKIADQEGMLVVERARPGAGADELLALILRDRAHPSILAWNLADLKEDDAHAARKLDPTRFLLVGSGHEQKLWAPRQDEPSTVEMPPGLSPIVP